VKWERFGLPLINEVLEIRHLEVVEVPELKRRLDGADLVETSIEEPLAVFVADDRQNACSHIYGK